MPIRDENEKEIEQELVMGKRAEETGPEKPMLDKGKASLDLSKPLWNERLSVDHDFSPFWTGS